MSILARIALRNTGRHYRRTIITVMAMSVGVAMSIATISFADGWLGQIFETLVGQEIGHVQVHTHDYPRQKLLHETISNSSEIISRLDALPESYAVSPRSRGFALLAAGDEAAGVQLNGIDPTREKGVTRIFDSMISGDFLDGSSGKIIIGSGLASSLRVVPGDEIIAVTQAADGSMGNALFTVQGIYRTGSVKLDRGGAFVPISDIQSLLALDESIHEIAIVTSDRDAINNLLSAVRRELAKEDLLIRSWADIDPSTAQILELTDAMVWIILLFVFSVASLGILNTMLMSVFERIKELGVLKALGLRPVQVLRLVFWETFILAVFAAIFGGGTGIIFSWLLEVRGLDLSSLVEDTTVMGMAFESLVYGELRFDRVIQITAMMFVISFLASIWPAYRAARLDPVESMREN